MLDNNFSLVLAGGGAKGAYQLGAFKAIKEFDININAYSGSSIGGINSLFFSNLDINEVENIWNNVDFYNFFEEDDNPFDGLSSRDFLTNLIYEKISMEKLLEAPPIFNTISRDGIAEYLCLNNKNKNDLINIVLATSALPIIYSKVNIDGKFYQDGGLADNLPIEPLYSVGFKNFIVISMSKDLRVDKNKYFPEKLIEIYPCNDIGHFFDGTINFNKNYLNFLIDLGYKDAKYALNEYFGIKNYLSREDEFNQSMVDYKINKINSKIDERLDYLRKYL